MNKIIATLVAVLLSYVFSFALPAFADNTGGGSVGGTTTVQPLSCAMWTNSAAVYTGDRATLSWSMPQGSIIFIRDTATGAVIGPFSASDSASIILNTTTTFVGTVWDNNGFNPHREATCTLVVAVKQPPYLYGCWQTAMENLRTMDAGEKRDDSEFNSYMLVYITSAGRDEKSLLFFSGYVLGYNSTATFTFNPAEAENMVDGKIVIDEPGFPGHSWNKYTFTMPLIISQKKSDHLFGAVNVKLVDQTGATDLYIGFSSMTRVDQNLCTGAGGMGKPQQ